MCKEAWAYTGFMLSSLLLCELQSDFQGLLHGNCVVMAGVKVCSTHLFEETVGEKSLVDEALERVSFDSS